LILTDSAELADDYEEEECNGRSKAKHPAPPKALYQVPFQPIIADCRCRHER